MRKKKKPQRGDGMATYPLSFRHSSGVLMGGDAFIQGLRYRLPLPKVCRSFGAYNPHDLIPNSRSDECGAFMQGLRYRSPLPKVCRPFGAYNPHNLIPNSRSDGGGTFISGRASCGIHHLPAFHRSSGALSIEHLLDILLF